MERIETERKGEEGLMKTKQLFDSINALQLLPKEHKEAALHCEMRVRAWEQEKKDLGSMFNTLVRKKFRDGLGQGYSIETNFSGCLVNYAAKENPIRPMVEVTIYLPHRSKEQRIHCRCKLNLSYLPKDEADLTQWCKKWIAWIKSAP